jgi:hypothetical protein
MYYCLVYMYNGGEYSVVGSLLNDRYGINDALTKCPPTERPSNIWTPTKRPRGFPCNISTPDGTSMDIYPPYLRSGCNITVTKFPHILTWIV